MAKVVGEFSKALNASTTLEWKGKTYKLAPMGALGVKAGFEMWMKVEALKTARELAKELPPEEAAAFMDGTRQDIGAGLYRFMGKQTGKALETMDGITYMTFLMIHQNHPEFTLSMAQEMADEKMDEIVARIDLAQLGNPEAPTTETESGTNEKSA